MSDLARLFPTPHPSEFIQDEMDARGWSYDHLAIAMAPHDDLSDGHCRLMLDAYFIIGPDDAQMRLGDSMAKMLSGAFGISKQFFLNLEIAWLTEVTTPTTVDPKET